MARQIIQAVICQRVTVNPMPAEIAGGAILDQQEEGVIIGIVDTVNGVVIEIDFHSAFLLADRSWPGAFAPWPGFAPAGGYRGVRG